MDKTYLKILWLLCMMCLFAAKPAFATPHTSLTIPLHQSHAMTYTTPIETFWITNPEIIESQLRDAKHIDLRAKKLGDTGLYIMNKAGKITQQYHISVVQDLSGLQSMLDQRFKNKTLKVTPIGKNGVALEGLAYSPDEAASVLKSTATFTGNAKNIINLMQIKPKVQVQLDIIMMEISRTAERNLGLDWSIDYIGAASNAALHTILMPSQFLTDPLTVVRLAGDITRSHFGLNSVLHLLEKNQLANVLSKPHLMTLSGETASFVVGGEFPYLGLTSVGTAPPIIYKQYGMTLAFSPTVLEDGTIHLQIKSELSQFTKEGAADFNGEIIPALKTRRAQTEVVCQNGQHIAISGLLEGDADKLFEQLPGLGTVPVLGALFRSQAFQRKETEFIMIATPHLVNAAGNEGLTSPAKGLDKEGIANQTSAIRRARGTQENIGFILSKAPN